MRFVIHLARWIYARGLRLFPIHFRDRFGSEMEVIFRARMMEEAGDGWRKLMVVCLQEFLGLLISLFREHWIDKELLMKNIFSNQSGRMSRWSALGFGIAFAVIKGLSFAGIHGGTILYLLGGLLGGFLFGLAVNDRRQVKAIAFLGALAFGGGHSLATFFLNGFVQNIDPESLWVLVVPLLEPALVGGLIGAGIGMLERDWLGGIWLTALTALGFGLGQIAGFLVSMPIWGLAQAVDSYRPYFNGQLSAWVLTLGTALIVVGTNTIAGLVGGATLGKAIEKLETA